MLCCDPPGHEGSWSNPNSRYRNPKQIQMSKTQMFKTKKDLAPGFGLGGFEFGAFGFWYGFEFRVLPQNLTHSFRRFSRYMSCVMLQAFIGPVW
jgi:hypothetical protein